MNGDDQTPTHLIQIIAAILPFITPSLIALLDTLNKVLILKLQQLLTGPLQEPPEPDYLDMREEIERWLDEEEIWERLITSGDK